MKFFNGLILLLALCSTCIASQLVPYGLSTKTNERQLFEKNLQRQFQRKLGVIPQQLKDGLKYVAKVVVDIASNCAKTFVGQFPFVNDIVNWLSGAIKGLIDKMRRRRLYSRRMNFITKPICQAAVHPACWAFHQAISLALTAAFPTIPFPVNQCMTGPIEDHCNADLPKNCS